MKLPKKIANWAPALIGAGAVALIILAWQAQYFKVDASAETLLMKGNKLYIESLATEEKYNPKEFILVAFKPSKHHIFDTKNLDILVNLEREFKKIERVESVRSIANVPMFLEIDELDSKIDPDQLTWKSNRQTKDHLESKLKSHPLYESLLFNRKHTATSLQIVFKSPKKIVDLDHDILEITKNLLSSADLTAAQDKQLSILQKKRQSLVDELNMTRSREIEQIRQILVDFQDKGEFYLGGSNLLADQLIDIIKSDLVVFGGAVCLIIAFVLLIIYRKFRWVFIPLACCATSVLTTIGLLGAFNLRVTVISANVVALQIILTLAVIIHLIEHYRELAHKHKDLEHRELVVRTIEQKFKPCFYAGLTTSIGFGSLIFSGVQPVISFGWMMVLSMAVTLFVSLIVFPSLLLTFFKTVETGHSNKWIKEYINRLALSVVDNPKRYLVSGTIVTFIGLGACFLLTSENSFLNYFDDSTDVYRELSFIDKEFGGSTPLDILYKIPKSKQADDLVLTAKALQTLDRIDLFLEKEPAIGSITSIADFIKIATVVNKKPITEYELTALYKVLDPSLRNDLFASYFSASHNELRIGTRIIDTTPNLKRSALLEKIKSHLKEVGLSQEDYKLTGLFVLYQDILERLVESQWKTLLIVYSAMFLVLLFIFKSFTITLIALVPNVITTAIIMGLMGALKIPLDLMTITIAAVAMGISVDDTIHYVHRYLEESKENEGKQTILNSHLSVGFALLYSTSIIIVGFSSLIFSNFVPSMQFGALTSAAMLVALITDVTVLPALLHLHSGNMKSGK
ncbi:MMPL family transporter [Oligoflexaceae bacterium]|nr:MMPL family transporter [Oligoflexaceae bacterium]